MFENMTDDFLRERMLSRIPGKMDTRPSSLIYDTHEAAANELAILYIEMEYLVRNSYGDSAAREFLVLLCKDRGISPEPATRAVLRGMFAPDGLVAAGQRFNIGEMNYVFTGKRIEDAEGGWEVACETEGTGGNRYLGKMIPMDYIAGLKTAELTEVLVPGRDEEDTETLRQRYLNSFRVQAFSGNRADYLAKTRGIEGVGGVRITRIWNGDIRPGEMIPSDTVKAWYTGIIGTLPAETAAWLSAVYLAACGKKLTVGGTVLVTIVNSNDFGEASSVLLERVQTILDPEQNAGEGYGLAPIGHVVNVKSARAVAVEVKTTLVFEEGYGWNNLNGVVRDTVEAYLLELRKQWADSSYTVVRVSQIEARLLGVKGIMDISNTKLNGSAANVVLGMYEIPVAGGVSAE